MSKHLPKKTTEGFTLTETIITATIVAILSSIALPNYKESVCKSNQSEAVSELSMLQTTAMSYKDEFGNQPESWEQMNTIATTQTLTSDGSKSKASGLLKGTTQKLRSGKYEIMTESTNETLTFIAVPLQGCEYYVVEACINTKDGESDIERGNQTTSIATTAC
jgi:prepilin-type N-terminal cleavage/methylation domain-containing protein